jgi:hypothetical protein
MTDSRNQTVREVFSEYYRRCAPGGDYQFNQDPEFVARTGSQYAAQLKERLPESHHKMFLQWAEVNLGWLRLSQLSDAISHYATEHADELRRERKELREFVSWLRMRALSAQYLRQQERVIPERASKAIEAISCASEGRRAKDVYAQMADDAARRKAFWQWVHSSDVPGEVIELVEEQAKLMEQECQEFANLRREDRKSRMRAIRHQVKQATKAKRIDGFNAKKE